MAGRIAVRDGELAVDRNAKSRWSRKPLSSNRACSENTAFSSPSCSGSSWRRCALWLSDTICDATEAAMYAGGGRTVVGIWKVTELATEGRSLVKLGAMLERLDMMSPVSEEVWRCMVGECAIAGIAGRMPSSLARWSLTMEAT